jgi:hypothetical protein
MKRRSGPRPRRRQAIAAIAIAGSMIEVSRRLRWRGRRAFG